MRYCYARGYLQCFWECGGSLAAPAVVRHPHACLSGFLLTWLDAQGDSVIHKVLAFIAPKLVGGADAPTPLGDLGLLEMTQAIQLLDSSFELVGPDLLVSAYTPSSGGLSAVASAQCPPQASPAEEVLFYKSWDEFGGLSNFSPHAIRISQGQGTHEWQTVEVRDFLKTLSVRC